MSFIHAEQFNILGKNGEGRTVCKTWSNFIFKDMVTVFERPKVSNCGGREGLMSAGRKEGGWSSAVCAWKGGLRNRTPGTGSGEGLTVSL